MEAKYVAEVKRLIKQREKLTAKIRRVSKKAFPEGSWVSFERGRGLVEASIINNYGERIRLLSATGKTYPVDLFWLLK